MCDEENVVVIDMGSGSIKAGIAGDEVPSVVFPTVVGYNLSTYNTYIGDDAAGRAGVCSIKYPMERGIVQDWDEMERIIHNTFYEQLRVDPPEHPILMTETRPTPRANREKLASTLFETFYVPSLSLHDQTAIALVSAGRTVGVALNAGDGFCQATAINDLIPIENASGRIDLGGRDMTKLMVEMMGSQGYNFRGIDFIASSIKENLCYVALDYEAEKRKGSEIEKEYELPDSSVVKLRNERFTCSELLFNPSVNHITSDGIVDIICKSIEKAPRSYHEDLYGNICVFGGCSMLPGFRERIEREIKAKVPASTNVKIVAGDDRKYGTWIGGSILGSLANFMESAVTREQYEESGPQIIHQKFN